MTIAQIVRDPKLVSVSEVSKGVVEDIHATAKYLECIINSRGNCVGCGPFKGITAYGVLERVNNWLDGVRMHT